ncbi:MAG: GntR family transcriptional regulator [Bacilli bacterium]
MDKIDKNSTLPMHQQLYIILKDKIQSGLYKEETIIPSESEIQKEYGISRITVRRAVSDLEHDGYVSKKRGVGAVVLSQKKYKDSFLFSGFTDDAKNRGEIPGSIILDCKEIEANVKVSEMLRIELGEKIGYLKRLRLLNGRIVGLHETYISLRYGFHIIDSDFNSLTSLYDFYDKHGIELGYADETIEAKMPSAAIKNELYMDETQPVFYRERTTYDSSGDIVEYSQNYYKADSYKYYVHLDKKKK